MPWINIMYSSSMSQKRMNWEGKIYLVRDFARVVNNYTLLDSDVYTKPKWKH